MALAGILPPTCDVITPIADQVDVDGPRFGDANPNDQLRFLQRAHYKHLRGIARLFSNMFPQSFIISLLPTHRECDDLAEAMAQYLMSFFGQMCPVTFRMDNLKVDPTKCPGWGSVGELIPVCTVVRKDTNGVLFCIHVQPPQKEVEIWRPDTPSSPRVSATFRSAILLMGPTSDPQLVRSTILNAYVARGGWIICGHNAVLYDVALQQMVDCASAESRLKQNCMALAKATIRQLCRSKRPIHTRLIQSYLRLSDHFGWPIPEGALDGLLSDAFQKTEKAQVLEGGRLLLNSSNQNEMVLLQLIRSALEADDGQLLKDFLTNILSPDPAPEYHPVTGSLGSRLEPEVEPKPSTEDRVVLHKGLQQMEDRDKQSTKKAKVTKRRRSSDRRDASRSPDIRQRRSYPDSPPARPRRRSPSPKLIEPRKPRRSPSPYMGHGRDRHRNVKRPRPGRSRSVERTHVVRRMRSRS